MNLGKRAMLDGGKIYNPGDRNGRTVQAQEIELMWDGNMIGALVGPDPVEVCGTRTCIFISSRPTLPG